MQRYFIIFVLNIIIEFAFETWRSYFHYIVEKCINARKLLLYNLLKPPKGEIICTIWLVKHVKYKHIQSIDQGLYVPVSRN